MARWSSIALLMAALAAAGCTPTDLTSALSPEEAPKLAQAADPTVYASRMDGDRMLPAIDAAKFDPAFLRTRVPYETTEAPGTVVIDTARRQLFFVEPDGELHDFPADDVLIAGLPSPPEGTRIDRVDVVVRVRR